MPRVHSQNAGKDYPESGIKKGQLYYKWSFRYGGTHKSASYPRASQLTQSKYSGVYAALEGIEDACADSAVEFADLVSTIEDAASDVRCIGEEYTEADEAMGGHQGINCERAESCEQCASELEEVASRFDGMEFGKDEEYKTEAEGREALVDEATSVSLDEV